MKSFLAIYKCAENSENHKAWNQLDPQTQEDRKKNGFLKLQQWTEKYKNQFVFQGGPLGEHTKKIDNHGIHDISSQMGAFLVIQADSHENAAKIFLEHPHFSCFPGDAVEILECIDIPRGQV